MVQSSSVATCFSVNLYKCGLDPQGRDSLACTLAVDQQAFLCTPGGSVSTGSFRTGASLDLHCQDKFRKVTQDTHLTGNAKMQRYSQLFNPAHFYIIESYWPWMHPLPRLAPCQVRRLQRRANVCVCLCVGVRACVCSFISGGDSLLSIVMDAWLIMAQLKRALCIFCSFSVWLLSQSEQTIQCSERRESRPASLTFAVWEACACFFNTQSEMNALCEGENTNRVMKEDSFKRLFLFLLWCSSFPPLQLARSICVQVQAQVQR